jgi:O-antigen/teichoic acid export membrane protein
VLAALCLIGAIVVPSLLFLLMFGRELIGTVFGAVYAAALQPLPWLAVGMGLYCFCVALENTMIGLARTRITAFGAGVAATTTVAAGVALIPRLGLAGGGIAFAMGAGAELAVLAVFAVDVLARGSDRVAARRAA